jgi:hypothetical protein
MFRPERKKERGTGKKKELNHLYYSTDIIKLIISRRIRCMLHETCIGEIKKCIKISTEKCKERLGCK